MMRSRSPSVVLLRPRSRSPSLSSLTPTGRMIERRLFYRAQGKARQHWKEVFASFVLIACCVMVVTFIIAWHRKMSASHKPYRGSGQRGPFGLPAPTPTETAPNTAEEVYRPTYLAAPEIMPAKERIIALPVTEVPPTTVTADGPETAAAQGIHSSEVPLLPLTNTRGECSTPLCENLKDWFHKTVAIQADPCKERNTFVCDPSASFPGFNIPFAKRTAMARARGGDGVTKKQQRVSSGGGGEEELLKSCLEYADNPHEGLEDIAAFMSHFKLGFNRIADDPKEDPLERMMELSLDYGIDSPVSFSRKYNVTGEASAPFVFEVALNHEVKEFFTAIEPLDEEDTEDFYQLLLSRYALLNDSDVMKQIIESDGEISDFVNKTADSGRPVRMSIRDLANSTAITKERWRRLLVRFGRSETAVYEHVSADEQAVAFVAYLSQPGERLGMRRVLAWHVLRYLIGPKADFLSELNRTRSAGENPDDDIFTPAPEDKCNGLVAKVSGVPYRALDLLEGVEAVPTETIAHVARFMAEFQDAVASAFKGPAYTAGDATAVGNVSTAAVASPMTHVALFPGWTDDRAQHGNIFTALGGLNKSAVGATARSDTAGRSFLLEWLRRLRAWHALPPLVKALLPAMMSVVNVEQPAAFFRPPYYDTGAPPAYNFAALGQIIAQAMAHELVERRREDPAVADRWRRFWEHTDAVDADSIYCLRIGLDKNNTWRQTRLDESELADRASLDGALGSRIAYLAFLGTRREDSRQNGPTRELSGVELSSRQLFFVMHCALSCARRGGVTDGFGALPADQRCMVVYKARSRDVDKPCAQRGSTDIPNECRYI